MRRCELTAGRAVARPSLSCHRTCRQLILYTKTTSPTKCRHHTREAARVRPRTTKTTTSGERTRTLSRRRRRSASYLPFPRAVRIAAHAQVLGGGAAALLTVLPATIEPCRLPRDGLGLPGPSLPSIQFSRDLSP